MQSSTDNVQLFEALKDVGFTQFITLKLLKFIYILGVIGIAIGVVMTVLGGFSQGFMTGLGALVVGVIGALLAVLLLRVYMEIIAVVFRIAANTGKIAENTGRSQAAA